MDGMLSEMTSVQVAEWQAFYRLEHLGDHGDFRADLRAGIVAASALNAMRGKGQKAVQPDDLMPTFGPRYLPPEEVQARMLAMARSRPQGPVAANPRTKADGDARPA